MSDHKAPVVVYFDGLCEPSNPGGYACWAFVALARDGTEVFVQHGCIGKGLGMTNNRAEYQALIEALRWLDHTGYHGLTIRGDSQLVVRQMTGEYSVGSPNIRPLHKQASALADQVQARLEWVPREKNARADAYSRKAYKEARMRPVETQ